MYRSLYFKFIMIFVVFMITVMAVVGTVLLNSVTSYYTNDFKDQMTAFFNLDDSSDPLSGAMDAEDFALDLKERLQAYGTSLGIDNYRNYYILDMNGNFLEGSNEELGRELIKTPNMISAMGGIVGDTQVFGGEYCDYAVPMSGEEGECIVYIKDTQEEMQQISWRLFSIILTSVFFGLVIAAVLSFFLAKAITAPITTLTKNAKLIAEGDFAGNIDVHSNDEIGVLTANFNRMKIALKESMEEVSGERTKLETVFLYIKDAVIAFSEDGRVMQINKSAIELFGDAYDEDFDLSMMLSLFQINSTQAYISNDELGEQTYILRDVQMGDKALDINLGTLKYPDGNQLHEGMIAVIHDITIRAELDKSRREFVANVSHELRTPLTSIKGATETILSYPDMPDDMRNSFLNMAIEESNRMLRIVQDLLTLSRLDNNRTQWKITHFDLSHILEHIVDVMKKTPEVEERHHRIEYTVLGNLPEISGDRERLEQVIVNVMSNSVKYTAENGLVELSARPSSNGKNVVIKVKDNGMGIPEEDVPRLFERFYRVEKSRTSDTGGTGLGLAIAKEIVEAHGGNIHITSKLGEGTTVRVVLPVETGLESTN
ncbi:MAG: HAMP domain-containing protein [Clostridia bacterium]|nr:HAMP domain-containing protein [Clostridia bacterium]